MLQGRLTVNANFIHWLLLHMDADDVSILEEYAPSIFWVEEYRVRELLCMYPNLFSETWGGVGASSGSIRTADCDIGPFNYHRAHAITHTQSKQRNRQLIFSSGYPSSKCSPGIKLLK
jgi:hypothetical protein